MGEQHVLLTINDEGLVTKVGHDIGGSYEYTTEVDGKRYDNCVVCGKQSPYTSETHIDLRQGYVEGAGQGCFQPNECKQSNQNSRELITIPKYLIEQYPNNMLLGEAVRKYYWDNYK